MSWTGKPSLSMVRDSASLEPNTSKLTTLLWPGRSHFVPNITMGPPVLASVYKSVPGVFMDCHMMVADPKMVRAPRPSFSTHRRSTLTQTRSADDPSPDAQWVKDVAEAGGKSFTFHIESLAEPGTSPSCLFRVAAKLTRRLRPPAGFPRSLVPCPTFPPAPPRPLPPPRHTTPRSPTRCLPVRAELAHELVALIHAHKMRAAVAISPATPSSAISDKLGNSVDMMLVMTVVPGKGGQKFMAECVPKVAELRTRFPAKDIQVDGGVGPATVGCCARAGEWCFPLQRT